MIDRDIYMRSHVAATHYLLLGNRPTKASVAITGGSVLTTFDKANIALMAAQSQIDAIHLEFAENDAGQFGMVGICLFIPRENRCYVLTNCRLWLGKAGSRARILPADDNRGHFRLAPRELVRRQVPWHRFEVVT